MEDKTDNEVLKVTKPNKLVSVIIPAYNAEKTISETLDSVFAQTYTPYEVIVVNDGSTDNTLTILENYKKPIQIFSKENGGVSRARAFGFAQSKGDYIQYLDADDLLEPNKIELQLNALVENNADVAYGNWQKFKQDNNGIVITETITRRIEGDPEIEIFTDFWCPPAALLYCRTVCLKLNWREDLPIIQDARYLLDAAILRYTFVYTPHVVAKYRTDQSNSLSQKSGLKFIIDLYQNTRDLYQIWKEDFISQPEKKAILTKSLRHCINRLTVLDSKLAEQAIDFLLETEPSYLPPEKGSLRTFSKIIGYKNAEKIAGFKRSLKK